MTGRTLPLGDHWKDRLQVQHRSPPDFVEDENEVRDTPYASAIRVGLRELHLSAILCVNGVPTVAIRRTDGHDPATIHGIRSALWNQGLASILVEIADSTNTARIYSLTGIHASTGDFENEDRGLMEQIDAASPAINRLHTYITGAESGRIWHERASFFRSDERIDAVILNNLAVSHKRLTDLGFTNEQAHVALMQTMLIAYLEDREIIDEGYLERATNYHYSNWKVLLSAGDITAATRLFRRLRCDFSGDVFLDTSSLEEPIEKAHLTKMHLQVLGRFRTGNELLARDGSDRSLIWGYNFRYLSSDIISAAYNQFLYMQRASTSQVRAYPTPVCLADMVVSSLWSILSDSQKERGAFLDPVCGSGIFLVKIFKRICQHKLEAYPTETAIPWSDSLNMLSRIRGLADSPATARIAAFSLSLALLEQVPLHQTIEGSQGRYKLPQLCGTTIASRSFFENNHTSHQVDVIVGNPPSSSLPHIDPDVSRWVEHNKCPFPQNELAWAFTWNAIKHLTEAGVLAFILPAVSFLHNQARASIQARVALSRHTTIRQVIEFSDLQRMLYPESTRSDALIVATKQESNSDASYILDYLTPMADPQLVNRRSVSVTSHDRKWVTSREIRRDSLVFKHRLHMCASELGLFQYLSGLPTFGDRKVESSHTNTLRSQPSLGQEFRPIPNSNLNHPAVSGPMSSVTPVASIAGLTPVRINPHTLTPIGFEDASYVGPVGEDHGTCILVPRTVSAGKWRIGATYVDQPIIVPRDIMAINVPKGGESTAKFVTAVLNSRLMSWFAFHVTTIFEPDRPEMRWRDLARIPVPSPSDFFENAEAQGVFKELVQEVDRFTAPSPSDESVGRVLQEIDRLTYAYFGLSEIEIELVEETVNCVMPTTRPAHGTYPSTWHTSGYLDRQAYVTTFREWLADWFTGDYAPSVRMYACNDDYAILEVSLTADPAKSYTETGCKSFSSALAEFAHAVEEPVNSNFSVNLDLRFLVRGNLYMVKALQKRFWLRSTALEDAGSIVADLESLRQRSRGRGTPP